MRPEQVPGGVIPANLIMFDAGLKIDERNYRRHIRHLVDTPGVAGLTTNAHASEVATLTPEAFQEGFDAWREVPDAEGIEPTIEAHQGGSGSR